MQQQNNKSFMTTDNISIMCRNSLLCLLLNMNRIKSTDFLYLLLLMVINMYKHNYGKSRNQNFTR